jgi:hypothetical protein
MIGAMLPSTALLVAVGCGGQQNARDATASAVGNLRTINTAAITYASTYPTIGFPPELRHMGTGEDSPCTATEERACLIDSVLASGEKNGYVFIYSPGETDEDGATVSYSVIAKPLNVTAESLTFFSDESCVIRSAIGREADASSEPIQ